MARKNSTVSVKSNLANNFAAGFPPLIRNGNKEVVYEIKVDSDDIRKAIVDDSIKDTPEGLLWKDIESENSLRSFRVKGWRVLG